MAVICLITPGHLSTNPRLVKEADALSSSGHDVRVIAASYFGWARTSDEEFGARPWQVEATLQFGPLTSSRACRLLQVSRQRLARITAAVGVQHPAVIRAAWHPIAPDLMKAASRVTADLYVAHYPAALPAAAIA